MQLDGRLRAVDGAIRDALLHCASIVSRDPRIRVLIRALTFSSGARWHVAQPVPVEDLTWPALPPAGGYTDLGAALREVSGALGALPEDPTALPPVLVLVSDGEPTDEYQIGLQVLASAPWGARAQRFAVGIGPDADLAVLQEFLGRPDARPVHVARPDHLAEVLRAVWSGAHQAAAARVGPAVARPAGPPRSDPVNGIRPVRWERGTPERARAGPSAAIDFGTTYTSAAVRDAAGTVTTIAFDSGHTRYPSGVLRQPGGSLLVATQAEAQAAMHPHAFEPTPKRLVGHETVVLGGEEMAVVDLVAAVLRHAADEVHRQHGRGLPVVLTHPADWRGARLGMLVDAAGRAGLGEVTLVPEPVAAAAAYTSGDSVAVGALAAVYDLGGGTFDAAVVERTDDGWRLAGPPAGIDPLGGVDFDRLLLDHLGDVVADRKPEVWAKLDDPPDMAWRRHRRELQREVRAAKEALSAHPAWTVYVPGAEESVTVTAEDLERLIGPLVDRSVELMVATIAEAGCTPRDLHALYLTGGSSRIPLVHRRLWDALDTEPRTRADPKLVVVTGALG
ncbi:Hsp70 protein [Geodermatophilus pulveris]|uniref:Hsp70 protein n=2 Tax=Geodermatophilus pulveris TaxID=1564159 RepID=A0A239GLZ3_9ACTN|nr:Hsp70 protein [Geodermatophilus pulveris]